MIKCCQMSFWEDLFNYICCEKWLITQNYNMENFQPQSTDANFSSSTSKAFLACFNSSFIDNNSVQRLSLGKSYKSRLKMTQTTCYDTCLMLLSSDYFRHSSIISPPTNRILKMCTFRIKKRKSSVKSFPLLDAMSWALWTCVVLIIINGAMFSHKHKERQEAHIALRRTKLKK